MQRINPKHFLAQPGLVQRVLTTTTTAQANRLPVGRPVTPPDEALTVYERFHQKGSIAVASLPILSQTCQRLGQDMAGQIGHLDVRQNQKAAVIDNQVQIFTSALPAPTNPEVAIRQLPSRAAEGQRSQHPLPTADQIPKLRPA